MKVLLYAGSLKLVDKSGVGQAMKHQKKALELVNIPHTLNSKEEYDIIHLNTIFPNALWMAWLAKRRKKKIIYYAHSTMEDFRNSFIGSNLLAPLFKKWITFCYNHGDIVITPTEYSQNILATYAIKRPIYNLTNGIDTAYFKKTKRGRQRFRKKYDISEEEKVILSVGHYMERKGIIDFVKLAEKMPTYQFIWFGYTNLHLVPTNVKRALQHKLPNLHFPGYISRQELSDAYAGSDLFLFLTHEETEGIVLLEALAAKIPILIRDIPIYKEWLQNGQTVYKGRTIEDFEQTSKDIIEQRLPDLSENGFQLALERDIRVVSHKLMELYQL
ncbi:glycosyltransferase [Gracilibacillus kekensis]|uniref:1,2-diacylglycerol-3-alpha-glucose alpha-1,2-glucosyltransferase n=1 Tax=Gracilibacillus kekensis TaxID=1027249 RepID=A0A1M7QGG2_9BACI|nr:glycosyltransferase [Gracilibacillus kekensis]SHN30188.1 1,2-diacylglycerol-3-alpha-glucose alpha-1,2-glucosyltransferase [Gracilibacillus kekensis]